MHLLRVKINLVEGSFKAGSNLDCSVLLAHSKYWAFEAFGVIARFNNPVHDHAGDFSISISFQSLIDWVLLFAVRLATGWYMDEFHESTLFPIFGTDDIAILDKIDLLYSTTHCGLGDLGVIISYFVLARVLLLACTPMGHCVSLRSWYN